MSLPWRQEWRLATLCHAPVAEEAVAAHLPAGLAPDLLEGSAWISVVALEIGGLRWRGVPLPGRFAQVNLRTYVRCGDRRGVFFLALYNPSRLACIAGRSLWKLPYAQARVALVETAEHATARRLFSVRTPRGRMAAEVAAGASILDERETARARWLCERYLLFTVTDGGLRCAPIEHPPWELRAARAQVHDEGLLAAAVPGLATGGFSLAHRAEPVSAQIGGLENV